MQRDWSGRNWGGRRAGAGRKLGSRNRKTGLEYVEQARREVEELPLERLVRRMNDQSLPETYRDTLAVHAAPYLHAKLSSVEIIKKLQDLSLDEMQFLIREFENRQTLRRPLRLIEGSRS